MFRRRRGTKRSYGGVVKFSTRYRGGRGSAMVCQVPIPQIYITRHPYFQTNNTVTVAQFFLRTLLPSSLFNIDASGLDVGFAAALEQFWSTYVVLGCKYEVTIVNLDPTSSINFGIVFWPSNQTLSDFQELQYRPGSQTTMVSPIDSGANMKTLRGYVNFNQLFGVKMVNEEEFWGSLSTDPVRQMRMYIGTSSNDASAVYSIQTRINLTLYVKWFNRNDVGEPADVLRGGVLATSLVEQVKKSESKLSALKVHLAKHGINVVVE